MMDKYLKTTFTIILLTVFQSVISSQCNVDGGVISTNSSTNICAGDGMADLVNLELNGAAGTNNTYIFTDDNRNITEIAGDPPFNFEDTSSGVVLIYHLSFESDASGIEVGLNADDIQGCADLSNPISIVIKEVEGGVVSDEDGNTARTICTKDGDSDLFTLDLINNVGENQIWVVAEDDGTIKEFQNNPNFDLSNNTAGITNIYHISYTVVDGLAVGEDINSLEGCFDLSNAYEVKRLSGNTSGGTISTEDNTIVCSGDGEPDVINIEVTNNLDGNNRLLILDGADNILFISTNYTIDLESNSIDEAFIYNINYIDGLEGLEVGNNIADLNGCFDLSNDLEITKNNVDGGNITDDQGRTELQICVNDGSPDILDIHITGNEGNLNLLLITDENDIIIGATNGNLVEFTNSDPGICKIYNIAYINNSTQIESGTDINDLEGCYNLSNAIFVTRLDGNTNGGTLSTIDNTFLCAGDGVPDLVNVSITGQGSNNALYIVADTNGEILSLQDTATFNFNGAGGGICVIYYIDYVDGILNLETGKNIADIQGCFDLSNGITINRNGVDGGRLQTPFGDTIIVACIDDNASDIIEVDLLDAVGTSMNWFITDEADTIISLPDDVNSLDANELPEGKCIIYNVSYEDNFGGLAIGNTLGDLVGCFSLSNPLALIRTNEVTRPAEIFTNSNLNFCSGDGVPDRVVMAEIPGVGSNSINIVSDINGKIIMVTPSFNINFEGTDGGEYLIRNIRYGDQTRGIVKGGLVENIQGCFSLSNAIVLDIDFAEGGILTAQNGMTMIELCTGQSGGTITLDLEGASGDFSRYLVTDISGNIEEIAGFPFFDFSDFPSTSKLLWHLSYSSGIANLNVGGNINQLQGCYDLSNNITVVISEVDGGEIITSTGQTNVLVCAGEGTTDVIEVLLSEVKGNTRAWIISDRNGDIIAMPSGPSFTFEDMPSGTLRLRNISYVPGIENLEIGKNISDIEGCFSFSNIITVTINEIAEGTLRYPSGASFVNVCGSDDVRDTINLRLQNNKGINQSFFITSDNNIIVDIFSNVNRDVTNLSQGTYFVYSISYAELQGLSLGNDIDNLTGCFAITNNLQINVRTTAGGLLTNELNESNVQACLDGMSESAIININLTGNIGSFTDFTITNNDGTILVADAAPPFNLNNAGTGICKIYAVSYLNNIANKTNGENIADLEGCFSLSNPLTVTRTAVESFNIVTASNDILFETCIDDEIPDTITIRIAEEEVGLHTFLVTDTTGNILAIQNEEKFDFTNAGEGKCLVYSINYRDDIINLNIGQNIDSLEGCFAFSNSIEIIRNAGTGCSVSTIELDGITYELDLYPNPVSNRLKLQFDFDRKLIHSASIIDARGQQVMSIIPDQLLQSEIDVSPLPTGMYFIQMNIDGQIGTMSFIKN